MVITLEEGGEMKVISRSKTTLCQVQVNGMGVKQVLRAGGAQLCVLERILFIR